MSRLIASRLILRPFEAGDWDAVEAILLHPESTRFMHFAELTETERREWFDWCVANAQEPDVDPFYWAITGRDSGGVIGWVGIGSSSEPHEMGDRSIGYLLHRPYWNRGYMTEALRAVIADEFETRGAFRLRASCDVANPASARVMEKAGMRREKTVLDALVADKRSQRHHYVITRADLASAHDG